MGKYVIGFIIWLFGIACGLSINFFSIVYNLGWQDSARKIAQDFANNRKHQNIVKGDIKKNE